MYSLENKPLAKYATELALSPRRSKIDADKERQDLSHRLDGELKLTVLYWRYCKTVNRQHSEVYT